MDVIYGCGGAEGWRSIFNSAVDIDDHGSAVSIELDSPFLLNGFVKASTGKTIPVAFEPQKYVFASAPGNIPRTVEIDMTESSFDTSERGFVFKIVDQKGNNFRIRSEAKLTFLLESLLPKLGKEIGHDDITLHFVDDEGDAVLITSDGDLLEATNMVQGTGNHVVKLTVCIKETRRNVRENPTAVLAFGTVLACTIVLLTLTLLKPKK